MTEKYYPDVESNPSFPKIEEDVLKFWKEQKVFEASVENRPGGHDKEFVFYDGPPFANGLPHYGHLLTGFVKDLFARYQTQKGKRVERRFGWDCHGLPAEMGAEKELGISGTQAIKEYGIEKFNAYCRTSVMKFTGEWEQYVTRQARWVDFKNDYKTMDFTFMESTMWVFKQLFDKGLIYEAHRVLPYSWAAETPLSNFETRLDNSTREREDKAVYVTFELNTPPRGCEEARKHFIIAWTTTPWTLPSNLALAVGEMPYCHIDTLDNKSFIVAAEAKDRVAKALEEAGHRLIKLTNAEGKEIVPFCPVNGVDLVGLSYRPLFPYFASHPHSFKILDGSSFIEADSGTGVVHMAPGFGEEDQKVCEANGIALVVPVDNAGKFTDEIFDLPDLQLKGLNVIAENVAQFKFGEANERIIRWLKDHGHLIKQEQIKHNYPHCWRTDQPLIYRALPSWYVEVTKFKDRMVALNQQINWIPGHVKDGLFGKWLEGARDWSISRNRFWGAPVPIWRTESGKLKAFGSVKELSEFFGVEVKDLHRPFIDDLVKEENGETWRRVPDVLDCWFESGSMPYGQVHYPHEKAEWFEGHFPADFIVEYTAQTRGWFYTLMVLGTALFDKPPFLNCICHGVVLDAQGQKLSKRLNNYPDPNALFDQYGADALRWFMMASPVMRGSELYIDKEGLFIRDAVRLYLKPLWNAYNFFTLYANADGVRGELLGSSSGTAPHPTLSPQAGRGLDTPSPSQGEGRGEGSGLRTNHVMDRYILSKLKDAVAKVEAALDGYDTPTACAAITEFLDVLNNWYIRRSKERFWKPEKDDDKWDAYDTLYTVLHVLSRAAAPLLPLLTEEMYSGLVNGGKREVKHSVHLADWPQMGWVEEAEDVVKAMDFVRDICSSALAIRNKENIRVRQPLQSLKVITNNEIIQKAFIDDASSWSVYNGIVLDEVNVHRIEPDKGSIEQYASFKLQINFPLLGKKYGKLVPEIKAAATSGNWQAGADGRIALFKAKGEAAFVTLELEEGKLLLEPKADVPVHLKIQPLASNDAIVVLDTTVDDALRLEGFARDLVRMIQEARKNAKLNVGDRIMLTLSLSNEVLAAAKAHEGYIAEQVLAAKVAYGDAKGDYTTTQELEGESVGIGVTVAKQVAA